MLKVVPDCIFLPQKDYCERGKKGWQIWVFISLQAQDLTQLDQTQLDVT